MVNTGVSNRALTAAAKLRSTRSLNKDEEDPAFEADDALEAFDRCRQAPDGTVEAS
jgi:hypothetical protein